MKNEKNTVAIPFLIIVIIIGIAAFKQIDFENLNFKNTGLGIVYSLTFIVSVYFIVRGKKSKNN